MRAKVYKDSIISTIVDSAEASGNVKLSIKTV